MTETVAAECEASWYAVTGTAVPECRVLAGDLDVDVCVVGGEVAGLTVAYELARRGWSVAVLEAGRIGAGGAGIGTGIVAPGFSESPEGIIARVGAERARALWDLSVKGVELVRATIDELGPADIAPRPSLLIAERVDREHAARRAADLLRETFAAEAEFWPTEKVRAVLRSGALHQAVHFPQAFHIQPLNYLLSLAAAARRAGARIYERRAARAIDASGIRKQVDTPGGRVRARHIVLAAAGDLGTLHPALAGTVMPLAFPIGVTAPLGTALADAIRFRGAVVSGPAVGSHRIVGENRLLWSGALTARRTPPQRLAEHIRAVILRTYPQIRGLAVKHAWYARAEYAVHRMPQIGELAPGLWLAAAFGHQGIAAGAMAGDLIARAIREGDDRWRVFHSYGLVWAGGFVGRTITGAVLRFVHARGTLRERLAARVTVTFPEERTAEPTTVQAESSALESEPKRARRSKRRKASPPSTTPEVAVNAEDPSAAEPTKAAAVAQTEKRRRRRRQRPAHAVADAQAERGESYPIK